MPKIISFKTPSQQNKSLLGKLLENFNYLDRFTKTFLLIFIGIIITMPIVTTQLFDFRQRASLESINKSTPNDILIKYKTGVFEESKQQLREKFGISKTEEISELNAEKNRVESIEKRDELIEKIKEEIIVEYVEPNYIGKSQIQGYEKTEEQIAGEKEIEMTDPVPVAVLDTGTNHLIKTIKGYNFVDNNDNVADKDGSGTIFTKIITSVNQGIPVIPVKVGETKDKIYFWNLAKGIVFAVNQGAKVILITSGNDNDSQILQESVNFAFGKNALVVSAGGDQGYKGLLSPARLNNVIAVGATNASGTRQEWSGTGAELDFLAQGTKGSAYGTGVSAAYSAAILAGVFSSNVNLSNVDVEEIATSSVTNIGSSGWNEIYGWGRIEGGKTIEYAKNQKKEKDINAPIISINEPDPESLITETTNIYASAWDDTNISKVEFLINENKLGDDYAFPYIALLDPKTVSPGIHSLSAVAYDYFGNKSSPFSIIFEVIK